jgi:hypothetical protein
MNDLVRDESIVQRDRTGSESAGKKLGFLRKVQEHYRWAASWKASAGLSAILQWEFVNLMVKVAQKELKKCGQRNTRSADLDEGLRAG